jgi:hypothetical protein
VRLRDKPKLPSTLPTKEKQALLNDPKETFLFAFNAEPGERSIYMYRALAYAIDLGADELFIRELANDINKYWVNPLDETRLVNTLLNPALRKLL